MDIYEVISSKIIEKLNKGIIPWKKPWKTLVAKSYVTKKPYSLLNQLLLGRAGEYLTFNQVKELGGHVKKGAKSEFVVFWKLLKKTEMKDGEEVSKVIPLLRYYNVFHIDDTEGVTPHEDMSTYDFVGDDEADKVIEDYTKREHIPVFYGDNSAYYAPLMDTISLPNKNQFENTAEYYSTAFHELVHSTGTAKRLNRDMSGTFGTKEYAKEELVAEMGAAFSLGRLGIDTESSMDNNTAYIQSWKKRIEEDSHFIVTASSRAEKACKFIFGDTEAEEVVGE